VRTWIYLLRFVGNFRGKDSAAKAISLLYSYRRIIRVSRPLTSISNINKLPSMRCAKQVLQVLLHLFTMLSDGNDLLWWMHDLGFLKNEACKAWL
jgi:hypothetical protein